MLLRYVLVTPARKEAQFIELTIKSMVAQIVRPLKWVIVSDGSTDGTDDIVRSPACTLDCRAESPGLYGSFKSSHRLAYFDFSTLNSGEVAVG
jgi:glycosyltransferase involved in cell wall biosynthesis